MNLFYAFVGGFLYFGVVLPVSFWIGWKIADIILSFRKE